MKYVTSLSGLLCAAVFTATASSQPAFGAALENRFLKVERGETVTRVYRAGESEPFAVWGRAAEDLFFDIRLEGDSPFVYIDIAPRPGSAARRVGRMDLPEIKLSAFSQKPVAQGTGGLTAVDGHSGSFSYLAVAEPRSRRGVVAAWLTNLSASGIVGSCFDADGRVVLRPFAEYGRMLLPPGSALKRDTFVIGAFDDCRLGLETYADTVARRFDIVLPGQISGYTTWYSDRYGYSDRSENRNGCGAGTAESTLRFAEAAEKLRAFGFGYFQIDDFWQDGKFRNSTPARTFCRVDPTGPYKDGFKPVTAALAEKGIRTGIWYMPFAGLSYDEYWFDKSNLFVRAVADVKKPPKRIKGKSIVAGLKKGAPYETVWGGTCIDMTKPESRAYLASLTSTMTHEWGMRFIKFDGMWTAMACDLLGGNTWRNDHFDLAEYADPTKSNIEAFRLGCEVIRGSAAPGTFILACNLAQNPRSLAASYGLVDAMRVGGDNGPIDMFPGRYLAGPLDGTPRYFLNGRVWYNDPDPVYVRDAVPVGRARTFATWSALAGVLYNFSDWLPDLSAGRVEILKRTMAPHGVLTVRPIDFFERTLANAWVLEKGDRRIFGLYNWSTNETLKIDYPAAYAGLDPDKTYVGFDFWNGRFTKPFKGSLCAEIPADDCRVIACTPLADRPVLVSTSRHVASPVIDVTGEKWDGRTKTLSGTSKTVRGDAYELRFWVPDAYRCVSAGGGEIRREGNALTVKFADPGDKLEWKLVFR